MNLEHIRNSLRRRAQIRFLMKPIIMIGAFLLSNGINSLMIMPCAGAPVDNTTNSRQKAVTNKLLSTNAPYGYEEPPSSQWLAGNDLTIRDWLVTGSGCPKTRLSAPGDTQVKLVPTGAKAYDVLITVKQYELNGSIPVDPANPIFARQCTMLLAIYPGHGKKLSNIEGEASISARKGSNVSMNAVARLVLGKVNLATWKMEFDKGKTEYHDEKIHLNRTDDSAFEQLACEQPKLAGIVYTFVTWRDKFSDESLIRLTGGNTKLHLDFMDCTAGSKRNF